VTDLPLSWTVRTAKDPELAEIAGLLEEAARRGFTFDVVVCDKGYDAGSVYELIESLHAHTVIPLVKTKAVKEGKHKPPTCEHGEWTFAGSDAKRQASKWRCPTGERGFGRLKHEWGMLPLRVRRLPRVKVHVDLCILATLGDALVRCG
jgi:hypothetical protein